MSAFLLMGPWTTITSAEVSFGIHVPAPGPSAYADEVLQEAIDKIAESGGGVVTLIPYISNLLATPHDQ